MAKRAEPFGFVISRAEIAEVFGCTPRNVLYLVEEGLPRRADGRFDLRDCYPWAMARAKAKAATGPNRSQQIKDQLIEAQRVKIELETEIMRRTVLPVDLVGRVLNGVAASLASQLDSLGPRLAGELADIDDPKQVQDALFREARQLRAAIAESLRELAVAVAAGTEA